MRRQRTLAAGVSCSGVGLHGGAQVALRLEPAEPDVGVVFECANGQRVPARLAHVATSQRATGLAAGGAQVGTVEHLLAALYGLGVDKAEILHTAESLFHDHAPANHFALASCWIHRRHDQDGFGATMDPGRLPDYDFRFTSMAEMVEAHKAEVDA